MSVLVLAGTRKGLFLLRSDEGRRSWQLEGPVLTGWEVMHATLDPRNGKIYTATNNWTYGATVHRSADGGATWERAEEIGLPEESELTLARVLHVEPGHDERTLWLGGDPGALLRSEDGGATFEMVRGLTLHPTRDRWNPGAGGMCCHSISLDPSEPSRIYAAISAAGGFRTDDGGETWMPINKDVAADPQTEAIGILQRLDGYTTVGPAFSFDGERPAYASPPPPLGAHSAEVLAEAGYSGNEIAALAADGVIRLG